MIIVMHGRLTILTAREDGILAKFSRVTNEVSAFWIGFSFKSLVVELWLRSQERQPQIERLALHSEP